MEYPRRKHPRLKHYDYSRDGCYFVTICRTAEAPALSEVCVGRGLAPAGIRLTSAGRIAEEELLAIPSRFPFVRIDRYVVMPNHVHVLFQFQGEAAGASPRPTRPALTDVVGVFKSLTTRRYNAERGTPGGKLWQVSFYESVVDSERYYQEIWRYTDENPAKWVEDPYYCVYTPKGGIL